MNSSGDIPVNGLPQVQEAASSVLQGVSDSNANVSNQSKGAIPKIKPSGKRLSTSHKVKVNNNNEVVQNGQPDKLDRTPKGLMSESDPGKDLCHSTVNKPTATCLKDTADSSSSDENELLSISDDGCIYTYKTDDAADLPSSFYNLDVEAKSTPEVPAPQRDTVSPEMDFLEMDFDPGPSGSGDADSDSLSTAEGENAENLPQDPLLHNTAVEACTIEKPKVEPRNDTDKTQAKSVTTTKQESSKISSTTAPVLSLNSNIKQPVRMPWSCSLKQRTSNEANNYLRLSKCHLSCKGELSLFPSEEYSCDRKLEQVMIWSEEEACRKQVLQIGPSACGATAVLNVLSALKFNVPPIEKVKSAVQTRLRANRSPLAPYLVSRGAAGSTHEDMILGLTKLSNDQIYSRFFHMYPERVLNLNWWLQYWIAQGAVPIATLNLQKCIGTMPDAWHHQMIFGVGPCGVYLTNPLECVKPELLWPQLSSDSILLIRREDVLSRWNMNPCLDQVMGIRDRRWTSINVVGQIATMVRESHREYRPGFTTTSYINIPASYSAGITLSVRKDSQACQLLKRCPELPFLPTASEVCNTDIF